MIAVGDSANDLEMLSSAKSFLRECAASSLSLPNLDALLYFIGISSNEVNPLFKRVSVK